MPPLKGQLLAKRLGGPEDPAVPGVNGLMLSPEHGSGVLGQEPGHLCSGGTWRLRAMFQYYYHPYGHPEHQPRMFTLPIQPSIK